MTKRKQKNKNKSQKHSKRDLSAPRLASRRGPAILIITLACLCVILLVGMIWIVNRGESSVSSEKNLPFFSESGMSLDITGLEPASGVQISPVNKFDPLTGKNINATSPTTTYKGYVVAFCCEKSSAYKGGWNKMSESEKDAFVLKCLKGR